MPENTKQKEKMRKRILAIITTLMLSAAITCCGQSDTAKLPKGFQELTSKGDISFDYTLYSPEEGKELPVVVYFHGFGETYSVMDTKVVTTLTGDESQALHPCFILSPCIEDDVYLAQTDRDKLYSAVKNIVDQMASKGSIDPNRIYVCGNSFGGLATVEFTEKYAKDVAAAIVMCPALSYSQDSTRNLELMKDVPTWFAHATNDNVIPVTISKSAVETLERMGAKDVRLTELTDKEMLSVGALTGYHQADYAVMAYPEFSDWLFNQSK